MKLIGVDIGGTKTEIALLDHEGNILTSDKIFSAKLFETCSSPVEAIAEHILAFCTQIDFQIHNLLGIGIGVPGNIDQKHQRIGTCPNLPLLDGLSLETELRQFLGIPVVVENDVNLICLGEFNAGRGRGFENLACVYVGTGIGCGLILDKNLYVGADGMAGELGHTILVPDGRQCNCGQKGCLEMYCSGKALAIRASKILQKYDLGQCNQIGSKLVNWTDAEELISIAKSGHSEAINELNSAFYFLGLGVANLINVINPSLILLGGGILDGWSEGIDIVRDMARKHTRSILKERITIERPSLGGRAGLVGAAFLLQERLT